MSWNKLPDDLINLILSTRREILRIDACKIVLDRVSALTAEKWAAGVREGRTTRPILTPALATEMELAVEVLSGKESPKLWYYTFDLIEYCLWEDEYTGGSGAKYYNRIDAAYLTLIERFGWGSRLAVTLRRGVYSSW